MQLFVDIQLLKSIKLLLLKKIVLIILLNLD